MNNKELLEKYNVLLSENNRLIKENKRLKTLLGLTKTDPSKKQIAKNRSGITVNDEKSANSNLLPYVNNRSDSTSKIKLFMSLFKGRDDIYAKRWAVVILPQHHRDRQKQPFYRQALLCSQRAAGKQLQRAAKKGIVRSETHGTIDFVLGDRSNPACIRG